MPFRFCFDLPHQCSEFAFLKSNDERIVLRNNSQVFEGFGEWQLVIEGDHAPIGFDQVLCMGQPFS